MRRWIVALVILLAVGVLGIGYPVRAHASLIRSVPPANAVLDQAPAKIQLWFTETLEPSESGIDILDATGKAINTAPAVIDPADPTSMSVAPGPMPDGVYTVAWHNVSRDDGHPLTGSFAITIGQDQGATTATGTGSDLDVAPPADRVVVQWLLFVFASVILGGAGFRLLIWTPDADHPAADRWLRRALWIGWAGLGAAVIGSLGVQVSQIGTVDAAGLSRVLGTRFGLIWLARLVLWIALGASLIGRNRRAGTLTLILGIGFLLTISLMSHGEAAQAVIPALAADWLHLTTTGVWVGGLAAFVLVLTTLRKDPDATPLRATLTEHFSNMARVAIAILLLTGAYSAWLQVGSLDAFTGTRYGQMLLLKLALIAPLLLLGGVNFLLSQRRLREAADRHAPTRWSGLLRGLVSGELVLAVLVLLVVGALTSSVPARTVSEVQAAQASASEVTSYTDMQMTQAMHVILEIAPGYAGTNTFSVGLFSMATGEAINDATLVKLQFTAKDVVIGNSQLRLTPQGKGEYTVSGANMSLAGTWRVRVSVQRPNQYDEVVDFDVQLPPAPASPGRGPLPLQSTVLVLLGILGASGGGFLLRISERRAAGWRSAGWLLALGLLACSLIFVGAGLIPLINGQSQAAGTAADDMAALALVSRWLSMAAVIILGGAIVFTPLILQPALAAAARRSPGTRPGGSFSDDSGLFVVLVIGCITAALATLGEALFSAPGTASDLVGFRLLTLAGVGVLLGFRRSRWWRRDFAQRWWWGGALLCALALLTVDLSGPTASTLDPMLAAALDWAHLIALAILAGGLVALALALRWLHALASPFPGAMAQTTRRFFQVAAACLVAVGISGAIRAADAIGDPANLIDTSYGLALLVNLGLLVVMLVLVVWTLVTIPPRPDVDSAWYRRTLRLTAAGMVLGLLIVLATSALGSLPLPRDVFGTGIVQHKQAGDIRVILAATPGAPGKNKIDVFLRNSVGLPITDANTIALVFSMLDHDMGATTAVADNAGGGRYTAQGDYLQMVGMWRIDAVIGRSGQDSAGAEFILPIGMASPAPGPLVLAYPTRALLGLELIAAAIVLVVSSPRLRRFRAWAGGVVVVIAVLIGLVGAGVVTTGFAAGSVQAPLLNNPVPADAASLGRGQQIYQSMCSACHGLDGRGDGPAAAGIQPPPADFRVHMAAGHTDGQLFDWITNGIPNTAMPAWGSRLSEHDRWDVINYLRLFALSK